MNASRTATLACLSLCLVLAACGAPSPAPPADEREPARDETVFDDTVGLKREIPAAVEDAQRRRGDETRRQLEAAEGGG